MGKAGLDPRPGRALKGAPTSLVAVLAASLAFMLVLSTTQLASTGAGAAGDRRAPPRLLLQRGPGGLAMPQPQGEAAVSLHAPAVDGAEQQERAAPEQQQQSTDDDGSASDGDEEEGADETPTRSSHGTSSSSGSGGDSQLGLGPAAAISGSAGSPDSGLSDAADVAERLTLDKDADLASFADPGTHCAISPSHGKVALLFLTHGDLPHDLTWSAWMREARGLLPRGGLAGSDTFCLKQCDAAGNCVQQCGREAACNPLCVDALQRRMGPGRSPHTLQQQHLFSVYVHARPTLTDYREPSIFAGRLIPDRAIAKPGTHAVAAAVKRLLEAAVLDPRNERFVLIGNATVPLYHPTLFYQQLMSEGKSRVDACPHKDRFTLRHVRAVEAMKTSRFDPSRHWRKSSPWFVLNRRHAELVARDAELLPVFGKHCFTGVDEKGRMRTCPADEHYVPSLLAMYGMDNETTCDATGGAHQRWVPSADGDSAAARGPGQAAGKWMLYQPGHVTQELIARIRQEPGGPPDMHPSDESDLCEGWQAAGTAARQAFVDAAAASAATCSASLGNREWLKADAFAEAALDPQCALLARDFSQHAAKWVHRVYRSCTAALEVLECSQKLTDRDNFWFA